MYDPRDLASAIQKLRGSRTQSSLAKSVGVSSSTWCKWEKGDTVPQRISLPKIAQALGVTVDRLRAVIWECQAEREAAAPAISTKQPSEDPHSSSLIQMLRDIDRQLDSLLASKNTLLQILNRLTP